MTTDDKTRTELEAAVFRRLVEHLRGRTDVQNIDLMNLAGFCRNCLSNWLKEAADAKGEPMTKDLVASAWRTALDARGDWMPQVLTAADARLSRLREHGMSDAGGLVIASDQDSARAYAALLGRIAGQKLLQRKNNHRHEEQCRDELQDALAEKGQHLT